MWNQEKSRARKEYSLSSSQSLQEVTFRESAKGILLISMIAKGYRYILTVAHWNRPMSGQRGLYQDVQLGA